MQARVQRCLAAVRATAAERLRHGGACVAGVLRVGRTRAASLLPQGGDGAWEAEVEGDIEAADVDAKLECVRGRHSAQVP